MRDSICITSSGRPNRANVVSGVDDDGRWSEHTTVHPTPAFRRLYRGVIRLLNAKRERGRKDECGRERRSR